MIRLLTFFHRQKSHLLAIDIGTHSIKLMELKLTRGRPTLSALGSIATPALRDGRLDEEELVKSLTHLVDTTAVSTTEVLTAITGAKVITRQIRLPAMSDEELAKAVLTEAQEHIPVPITDLAIRYVKLGREQMDQAEYLNIMLIAVPTALVEQYYHIFLMAGLKVTAMDLQAFGLWRIFGQEQISNPLAVLDIGYGHSQLVVIKDGEIKYHRGMSEGGRTLKDPVGLDNLAREVQRSLDFYQSQPGGIPVTNIILTGGGCNIPGVADYLNNSWSITTEIRVPACWNSFIQDQPSLMQYDPSYAMALGLLLREVPSNV